VFALDRFLRRRQGIIQFSNAKTCILRVAIRPLRRELVLADGSVIGKGRHIADLHLWNEKMPSANGRGGAFAFGHNVSRCFEGSMRELVGYIEAQPEGTDVDGALGDLTLAAAEETRVLLRIAMHFGFQPVMPDRVSLAARCHRLGRNILVTMIVWAMSAGSARKSLVRTRLRVFITRKEMMARFGGRP
jgi:hypothetical protein